LSILNWGCIIGYFIVLGLIGFQTSRSTESVQDYNVAGEKVTGPILFASLAASVLGAVLQLEWLEMYLRMDMSLCLLFVHMELPVY